MSRPQNQPHDRIEAYRGADEPAMCVHLLGCVAFDDCLNLQHRLVAEAEQSCGTPRILVLLCEHPKLITVGRRGSRGHIALSDQQLRARGIQVRWIRRGGGCLLHAPGQLALYPIVPLGRLGWSVESYMGRLRAALQGALRDVGVRAATGPGFGLWGRSGKLAALGVALRGGVSYHGAFVNVNPAMTDFRSVHLAAPRSSRGSERRKTTMGSLLAERRQGVRMSGVRTAIVKNLAQSLQIDACHILTGHPQLAAPRRSPAS